MTLRLNGSTSGSVSLDAPATGSNVTLELPTDSIKPGLMLVATSTFSVASSVSVNNCFTSAYDRYLVEFEATPGTLNAHVEFRFRAGGADNSAADYFYSLDGLQGDGTRRTSNGNGATTGRVVNTPVNATRAAGWFNVSNPFSAGHKYIQGQSAYFYSNIGSMVLQNFFTGHRGSVSFDGFTLYPSSGTFDGSLAVYAYRKAL